METELGAESKIERPNWYPEALFIWRVVGPVGRLLVIITYIEDELKSLILEKKIPFREMRS